MNARIPQSKPASHPLLSEAKARKLKLWDEFCFNHEIGNDSVSLFQVAGESELLKRVVITKTFGKDNRLILQRSEEMDNRIISEVNKVTDDHYQKSSTYGGLIYMMFREGECLVPGSNGGAVQPFVCKFSNLYCRLVALFVFFHCQIVK